LLNWQQFPLSCLEQLIFFSGYIVVRAFVPALGGFFDSCDLPRGILVVHLGSAAELLYRAFPWAEAQPSVRLPSSLRPLLSLWHRD